MSDELLCLLCDNNMNASVTMDSTTMETFSTTANYSISGEYDPTKILMKKISDVLLVVLLAIIMMSLGCTIEVEHLIKQIKKPLPAFIGMLLQFVVYPLVVFGLANAFQLNQYNALGMLLIGTCPGGSLSNLITYWCSGDVVLSVCMTSLATTVAIGMMPLNLFIYSRAFTNTSLAVPYLNIFIGLVLLLVPVAIGILLHRKLPKVAVIVTHIGGVMGFLFILGVVAINFYLHPQMFDANWTLWLAGLLLPVFGLVIGYAGSRIACLPHTQCRTVGIEVSSQNVALCMTIIYISFKIKEATQIVLFPLIFGVFNVIVLVLFTIAVRIIFYLMNRRKHEEDDTETDSKRMEQL